MKCFYCENDFDAGKYHPVYGMEGICPKCMRKTIKDAKTKSKKTPAE